MNPYLRIRISVFIGETQEEAAARYFALRPEHAAARDIIYEARNCLRDSAADFLAGFQRMELQQVMAEIAETADRALPVRRVIGDRDQAQQGEAVE